MNRKVLLMILDGWGIARNKEVSAVDKARTPYINSLYTRYPHSQLDASGLAVGLPEGQMGNSEVGHMNIGAGRIVYQDLVRINKVVSEHELDRNPVLTAAYEYAKKNEAKVHLIGLVSDGGVHSHIDHLKSLCSIAQQQGLQRVFVHAFLDGRDTDPKGGIGYLAELQTHLSKTTGKIASQPASRKLAEKFHWPLEPESGWGPPGVVTMLTSRVCPWQCVFCNENSYIANMGRRSVDAVIDELNYLDTHHGPGGSVVIHDSMFFQNPTWLKEWVEKYPRKANKLWPYWAAARADTVRQWPDLFEAVVRETNWSTVSIGFESGSDRVLKIINKECTEEDNYFAIDLLTRIGDDMERKGQKPPVFWSNISLAFRARRMKTPSRRCGL